MDVVLVAGSALQRTEVLPLQVLDQRELQRLRVGELAHYCRDRLQPRELARAPTPLAGNELVATASHRAQEYGLDDAVRPDRLGQLFQAGLFARQARLPWIRRDRIDGYLADVGR